LDVALEERWLDFRDAVRDVGEGTGNGRPGLVTSDVFGTGVGSGEWKTLRTGAVIARPTPHPVTPIAINATDAIAVHLQFIAFL
jgi:hypothetical protein